MKRIDVAIAAAGTGLLVFVASRIGWVDIVRQLWTSRAAWLVLVGLSLIRLLLQTFSWSTALRAEGIRIRTAELIGIRLAAQSVSYLSVLGPVISEPMKIRLLRRCEGRVTAATLADSGAYGFASALFGTLGCVCAGLVMARGGGAASPVAFGIMLAAGLFLIAYRRPLLTPVVRRLASRCPAWLQKAEQIEIAIRQFGIRHRAPVYRMFWLDLACQLLLAAEVVAVFCALKLPLHAVTVLGLEAASRAVKVIAGWMPARIGADETGTIAAFAAFGLPASSGLVLALARRGRDLLVCVLGLAWLLWRIRSPRISHLPSQ